MRKFREKYIGNKDFYKTVLLVAIPIMIQNAITNFVSLLDNIMVGLVGFGCFCMKEEAREILKLHYCMQNSIYRR